MKTYLLIIIIVSLALRLIFISDFPAGFNADEAALGYNAYSLLLTGKDEHANVLPVNLESFGDFKPALYSYLLVPLVSIFGLEEWVVRLPSALFSIVGILAVYSLSGKLGFPRLATALVVAISPWHFHYSRGAWETNVSSVLIILGIYFFIKYKQATKFEDLVTSIAVFSLTIYTYQSSRITAPLVLMGLGLISFNTLLKHKHHLFLSILVGILLTTPFVISLFTSDASSRLTGVGLFSDEGPKNRANELRGQHRVWNSIESRFLHNRPVMYAISFTKNYLDHFSGNFLFINGDEIERNKSPETGQFHISYFFFLLVGMAFFVLDAKSPQSKIFWLLVLVAPLASAFTFQTPHATRSHLLLYPLSMLIALGVKKISQLKYLKYAVVILLVFEFSRYLHNYFVHYPKDLPISWQYGFRQLVQEVTTTAGINQKIYVTNTYDQPYIIFLFYLKYPPRDFQGNHELTFRDKFNFSTVNSFGKYVFTDTSWDKVSDVHPILIAASAKDVPSIGVNVIKTIYFPNGSEAFKIISN